MTTATQAPHSPQVFISGGGPTGLTAAAVLAKLGLSVRIADKNPERTPQSRALAVHAGTLECLEAAFGPELVAKFIAAGRPVRKAFFHLDDKEPREIDLAQIPSKHNYILVIPQSETERLLEELAQSFGVQIERGTEVTSLTGRGDRVNVSLKSPRGAEDFTAAFAIGADGAHSVVRHDMQAGFEGGTYEGDFILGDIVLEWPWAYDSVHALLTARGLIGGFPLKPDGHYRLIMVKTDVAPGQGLEITPEDFQSNVDFLSNRKIKIKKFGWMTRFKVHHRLADRFQSGRVFLAGDAAHIHSPAGGQGMNTGIQDALNLGYKIKAVVDGEPMDLLEDYEAERLPVARSVVRATDLFSRALLMHETPLSHLIRGLILPSLSGNGWVQRRMMTAVSQVKIARKEIQRYNPK